MSNTNRTYNPVQKLTVQAKEDIPEHRFVDHSGNLCGVADKSFGVSEIEWLNNQYISLITLGTAIIETDSAVNIGDPITSSTDGKAKVATGSDSINGRALDTVGVAGYIRVMLIQ